VALSGKGVFSLIRFESAKISLPYREKCEDRIAVFNDDDRLVIVVADGAGGVGSGDIAATTVIREIENEYRNINSADQWTELLNQIDCCISDGQSTAVVVDVRPYGIAGSSVGDSEAWIINNGKIEVLTENQSRKPLLGTGDAQAVSFVHSPLIGWLLVGSDGFFNYAKREQISNMLARTELATIPRTCVEMVRLPSGDLWDDTSIVVARNVARQSTRKRYQL
jgi:serine/threonine protein phosphatase PrpC